MAVTIEKVQDLKELSLFLATMNNQKQSHIGFCGENPEEIYQTLTEDFIDEDGDIKFFAAKNNNGEIIAAIGLDIDEAVAEVWGPFNQTSSIELQHELWEKLINANPFVQTFSFFINYENKQQQLFMIDINAERRGEHLSLVIKGENFDGVDKFKGTPFVLTDFQLFEKIHNDSFPGTYYDAKTIVERLSSENILKVLKTDSDEIQGYAYYEIDTEMAEASLEYIGIAEEFQNKGLGTLMLKEALTELFSYPEINEIALTVEHLNSQANHIYMKAGFEKKELLINYILEL